MNLPQKQAEFYAPCDPLSFVHSFKAACEKNNCDYTWEDGSFRFVARNAVFNKGAIASKLPRAKLIGRFEQSGDRTKICVDAITDEFATIEGVVCAGVFIVWLSFDSFPVIVSPATAGSINWQVRTWLFGTMLAIFLLSYCMARKKQVALLNEVLKQALAGCGAN